MVRRSAAQPIRDQRGIRKTETLLTEVSDTHGNDQKKNTLTSELLLRYPTFNGVRLCTRELRRSRFIEAIAFRVEVSDTSLSVCINPNAHNDTVIIRLGDVDCLLSLHPTQHVL